MTGKRSRLEMYLDVLEKINQGVSKPTNIMYKCNLSWRPLKEILRSLIEKGLVEETKRDNHKHYRITKKGKEILIYLGTLIQMLHPIGERVTSVSSNREGLMVTLQGDLKPDSLLGPREQDRREIS
jgi:predicted transcriptional regulator